MRVALTKSFTFEAAHWLPTFPPHHKCRRMHGHSFRVSIVVEGDVNPATGYLIDYGEMRAAYEPVRARLDHFLLNDIPGLDVPTAENIAAWIWRQIKPALPMLSAVIVDETCTSRCEYRGE
ncbi:MAG: 6-carboxytetrahydropterin synthase QueD [Phycisphaerales bacterium]|nr:6-carboxytetrahydropterin synthase QueD [Phycisphaerales bacterium]